MNGAQANTAFTDFYAGFYNSAGIREAICADSADGVAWDDQFDVLVIGFGGAGVAAAIEAADNGASVAAIDRFEGGGATATSGSVFYAGGGTDLQQQNNVNDTPATMEAYLKDEVGDVVRPETLHAFCQNSVANFDWAKQNGVRFGGKALPTKTTYPPHGYGLYFSGNESVKSSLSRAPAAQRGHVAAGISRFSAFGPAFYGPQKKTALKKGVNLLKQSRVTRLVCDKDKRVIGVELMEVRSGWHALKHRLLNRLIVKAHMFSADFADKQRKKIAAIEATHVRRRLIRARQGVVISAGGFIFNRHMIEQLTPNFRRAFRLGTTGDDGSGILLGASVGGRLDRMGHASAWRFINPPASWPKAIVINRQGDRYVNEACYGATIGAPMFEQHDGQAILIMDDKLFQKSRTEVTTKTARPVTILQSKAAFMTAHKEAPTLADLAKRIKADPDTLQATVDQYNQIAAGTIDDPFGKDQSECLPIGDGPYHAIDMSAGRGGVTPCITLGGLVVDEQTGVVQDHDGTPIAGLYAAGRSAVGIASNTYLSGLSLADGLFSGRRAGHHAATGNNLF